MTSPKIQLLPEFLIDQIKAGEVVERPSALLKELLENALDAHSTKIDIHLQGNGLDLIAVEDNGHGMKFEDLPIAFARHATSKIENYNDLYRLHTYGFRGEALASIASVSKVSCVSATRDSKGGKIVYEGGVQTTHLPHKSNKSGTSFYINDLFFNTPARLKFIQSASSEKKSLERIIYAFILEFPHVAFTLKWDDRPKRSFLPVKNDENKNLMKAARVKELFKYVKGDWHQIEVDYEGHTLFGLFSDESGKSSAGKHQYLLGNGRPFTDKKIHSIITRCLGTYWGHGHSGHYVFFLDVPKSLLDVNVHPNKTQIKFVRPAVVFSLFSESLKKKAKMLEEEKVGHSQNEHFESSPEQDLQEIQSKEIRLEGTSSQESSSQNNQFLSIDTQKGAALITLAGRTYFYSHSRAFAGTLERLLELNAAIPEESITPVLISSPFSASPFFTEDALEKLSVVGVKIDVLDEQTLALRALRDDLPFDWFYSGLLAFSSQLQSLMTYQNKPLPGALSFLDLQEFITSLNGPLLKDIHHKLLHEVTLDDYWERFCQSPS